MKLITAAQQQQLLANGRKQQDLMGTDEVLDFMPVIKLFTPDANATWLLTEVDPDQPDLAFGLCDLGLGYPELGHVSLSEVRQVRGKMNLPVERDMGFEADKTLSEYAKLAYQQQRIVA